MIVILGTLKFPAARRADIARALTPMLEASRAEPGCMYYALAFDPVDETLIRVSEAFADEAALEAHRVSAHMKTWRAATDDCVRTLSLYDAAQRAAP